MSATELIEWSKHIALTTPSVANFARKALIRCLPTNSNLHRWGRVPSDSCPHCSTLETENHILNNCPVAAGQGRYTWRHNAVLKSLAAYIQSHLHGLDELYVDLPGFKSPHDLYTSILPDITVVRGNSAVILELTCCYETNLEKSKLYKQLKYSNPQQDCKMPLDFTVLTAEVSSLGFIPLANPNKFCKLVGIPPLPPTTTRQLGETSLRCSYFIFCCRHKQWPTNPTDPFVPGTL
jgi:zinc-binding in reverse transcriptase